MHFFLTSTGNSGLITVQANKSVENKNKTLSFARLWCCSGDTTCPGVFERVSTSESAVCFCFFAISPHLYLRGTDARRSIRRIRNACDSKTEQSRASRNVNAIKSRIVANIPLTFETLILLFPNRSPSHVPLEHSRNIHLSRPFIVFGKPWSSTDNKFLCWKMRWTQFVAPNRHPFEWPCSAVAY